ncbi:DUF423 domain-containing protein [Arenibacter sp. M-2]|uniref:DUF423 domain-containing protein n=1 Tax=unclassified Arenibacter TaxID=2615047 RepID=UPI000D76A470|nr:MULTISPECIES: DUF423 domain-containing protein [unclassified Arenibacter]MDL5510965.1 DUF423 domain-containing protein [Arenibacter sp. M-2]PXX31614.1 uncharacterized membrane protein YgdD (TMEM256/DUF423 family) [Arenibacter sp. ARW7G5Y1]|tara:strand:+ start:5472 stop:5864 length:393 start_codon:yes stop_codon:yes gene_type:complete
MNKTIFGTGVFFGLTAVLLGAFGAHGLEKMIDAKAIETFETGVRYQMYHALFLMILGGCNVLINERKKTVYYFIVAGVVCFSFSIYLLALNELFSFDFKKLALLTPLGGVLLVTGWLLLGIRVLNQKPSN